jgi:hypothetical protein
MNSNGRYCGYSSVFGLNSMDSPPVAITDLKQSLPGIIMLSQFTVRQKLLAGFTLIIALMLVLLFAAISNMQTINSKMLDITQDRYPKIALTSTLPSRRWTLAGKYAMP